MRTVTWGEMGLAAAATGALIWKGGQMSTRVKDASQGAIALGVGGFAADRLVGSPVFSWESWGPGA